MRTVLCTLLICFVATATIALSQEKPKEPEKAAAPSTQGNPFIAYNKGIYRGVKGILLRSAEKMPEENYKFKPTDSVRSFGQVLGHVADSQYAFCSRVLGEKNPELKIEQTKTSKADLIAALKEAFAYCDKAHDGMTDETAVQMVKLFGGDTPKIGVLNVNSVHTVEHYGNLVTYMRMKDIIPPTSEPEFQPGAKKTQPKE